MSNFSEIQKSQEDQYSFPHHYVPRYRNGFSTVVYSGFGINYVSTIEFLLNKLNELEFSSLCDIGTGDGRLVKEISETFPGKVIFGLDYSEKAINIAKGLNPFLNFIQANIINDNIEKKFDVLTLIEVFEHIPLNETKQFVSSLHKLLNKNGILLVTVPHINKALSKKHYQHFSVNSLSDNFKEYFSIEEIVTFEKIKNWRIFFFRRLLKNKLFILNNKSILNCIYRSYKRKCFFTDEKSCSRIFLKLKKK